MSSVRSLRSGSPLKRRCRTCLMEVAKAAAVSATSKHYNVTYKDMLLSFCNIQFKVKNEFLCNECAQQIVMCYNFKLKCEKCDEILLNGAENSAEYPDEEKGFVKLLPLATLSIEQADSIPINYVNIKEETKYSDESEDDRSDVDDGNKEDVLPSVEFVGVKRLRDESEERSIEKKAKRKIKKDCDRPKDEEVLTDGKEESQRKTETWKQEEYGLTKDGFRRIYECPKCLYFCKTFIFMKKHFDRYHHQIKLESHQQYEEIVESEKKKDLLSNSTNKKKQNGDGSGKKCKDNVARSVDIIKNNENLTSGEKMLLFKCLECEYTNKVYNKMKLHILKHKEYKYIRCQDCDFRCPKVFHLLSHVCLYSDNTALHPFQCQLCGHTTTSNTRLKHHHASIHSDERPFACKQCSFKAKLKSGLLQHVQRIHEKLNKFSCSVCDKKFFTSNHLKKHTVTHTGGKQFMCDKCGSGFTSKSHLMQHIESMHTDKRPYACSWCIYRTFNPRTLAKHTMIHTGQKPNACHLCPYTCVKSNILELHIARHKGEKNFSCSTCPYKCYSSDRLKDHELIHSEEKPFLCQQCSYRGRSKAHLNYHMISHRNERKHLCTKCPYKANYKSSLRKHISSNCGKFGQKYKADVVKAAILQHDIPPTSNDTEKSTDIPLSVEESDMKLKIE